MYQNIAVLALFAVVYAVVAGRLDRSPINGALVFVVFGVIAGPVSLGFLYLPIEGEGIRVLAELTLALVLFTDASKADLGVLRQAIRLPGRSTLRTGTRTTGHITLRPTTGSSRSLPKWEHRASPWRHR